MQLHTGVAQVAILAFSALLVIPNALQAREQGGNKKPSLSLKVTPAVTFAPARVVVVAEVKGDCEPYDAAKSQIRRRYTVEHQFKNPGSFRIRLSLKKGDKVIGSSNTLVQVRPGLGDPGGQ